MLYFSFLCITVFKIKLFNAVKSIRSNGPLYLNIISKPQREVWFSRQNMGKHKIGENEINGQEIRVVSFYWKKVHQPLKPEDMNAKAQKCWSSMNQCNWAQQYYEPQGGTRRTRAGSSLIHHKWEDVVK